MEGKTIQSGRLRHYSPIPNAKPDWLLSVQLWVSQKYSNWDYDDDPAFWTDLEEYIQEKIMDVQYHHHKLVRSDIQTAIVEDNGKTTLHIKRNGKPVQIYYLDIKE